MAITNPSSLYSGGNVRLDPTPYLRLAIQERIRKEARGQAIEQYYQKLPETLNDKGVRDQEVPIIADYKNKMAQAWMDNRDAIRRGDPQAQLRVQQLFREAQAVARKSQIAGQTDKQLGQMWFDKNNQPILNSEDFIQKHQQHNLPVTDPDFKPLDIAEVMANRPFNQDDYVKQIKGNFKYGEGVPTITPHPTDKNLEVVTTNPILDDQTKENIYASSAYKLHNDIAFQRQLRRDFSTPEQIAPLNEVSKKVFGHDISEPEDIAAAYTASLLPSSTVRQNVRTSIDALNKTREDAATLAFERRKKLLNLQDRLIKGRKVNGVDTDEVDYPTNVLADELGVEKEMFDSTGKSIGNKKIVYVEDIPVGTHRGINPKDINKGIYPVQPKEEDQRNGKFRPYYEVETDKNGNVDFIGKGGKKIGAEDARNNFIKEVVPTKAKLQINKSRPSTTRPKKDPLGIF